MSSSVVTVKDHHVFSITKKKKTDIQCKLEIHHAVWTATFIVSFIAHFGCFLEKMFILNIKKLNLLCC